MEEEKAPFDWGIVFSALACLFLGGSLFLFIRNNHLLAHGARNLWRPDAIVMLGVITVPFILVVFHFVRTLRRQQKTHM